MSILSHYTWNEDDTANTRDYSTEGNDSTAMVVTSILDAERGKAVNLNGSTGVITYGDINNFGGTNKLTIIARVRPSSTKEQVIAHKKDQYSFGIDVSAKAFMKLTIGASVFEFTSSGSVATGGDYKTVMWTYDGAGGGSGMSIYIEGALDGSQAQTGNLDASVENFLIGSDLTDFYNGRIEMLAAYDDNKDAAAALALHNQPGGIFLDLDDSSGFEIGDLIEAIEADTISQGVIAGDLGSNNILYLPLSGDIPNSLHVIRRRGNVFNTSRQWISETIIESEDMIVQIKDRVSSFTQAAASVEGTVGHRYTREALKWKTAICVDFAIEPAAQVGSIDDFSPTDLAIANVLFISSTSPVSWTGLLAPSPSKPQLILIVNIGSFNITIRNNDASSLAANRFSVNNNVAISPNDCGYLFYDITRSRWRVNKI